MIRKIERDFLRADLASVEGLLAGMTSEDALTAMSLGTRKDELASDLASLDSTPETKGAAALFFSGLPVVGSRGIESEFASAAVGKYQELVSKVHALRVAGSLARTGTIPMKEQSRLHITGVLRGSFGFCLEELGGDQPDLISSPLKDAIDQASALMDSFGEADDEQFMAAVEKVDERVLSTVREFFDLLNADGATFRLVAGERDKSFDRVAVERAAERARVTSVSEAIEPFEGTLAGVLPEGRMFEFRTQTDRGTIRGQIAPDFSGMTESLPELSEQWIGRPLHASVRVKKVSRGGRLQREAFTLLHLSAPALPPRGDQSSASQI